MKLAELAKAYDDGKIEKKLFWSIMREKFLAIEEYAEFLKINNACESIEITKNGIILNNNFGIKIYFDFAQTICRAEIMYYMNGDGEDDNIKFISTLIKADDVFFDVGANVALFSLQMDAMTKGLTYYAFEPLPPTFAKLQKTLKLNNASNINAFNVGMSDKKGCFDFYLPGTSEAASLKPVTDEFYLKESDTSGKYVGGNKMEKVLCQVTTLDDFCTENSISRMDFMKIDVEGNEIFALKGATNTLKTLKPMIYCEMLRKHAARFGYHPNDIIAMMKGMGYGCYTINVNSIEKFESMDEQTVETNFLFLNLEKHAAIIQKYLK